MERGIITLSNEASSEKSLLQISPIAQSEFQARHGHPRLLAQEPACICPASALHLPCIRPASALHPPCICPASAQGGGEAPPSPLNLLDLLDLVELADLLDLLDLLDPKQSTSRVMPAAALHPFGLQGLEALKA